MASLPTGTVTFLFTDMEGSTRLVQQLADRWPDIVATHDGLVRSAVVANDGVEVRTEGDSFFAAFGSAVDAVAAVVAAQRAIADHEWPEDVTVRVRAGLHTGAGTLGGSDYVGIDVHRAARVSAAAHGGQILLSEATALLAERNLPGDCFLRDLGKHRLKDLLEPESLHQVVIPGVSNEFPPLRTLEGIPNNLPIQVTSFVGREDEIAQVSQLLAERRIVTLLGPGGTGKTRLALQVAAEAADEFVDGVFFVGLAPVTDSDLIATTVLAAIGVSSPPARPPREHLLEVTSGKTILLVLDNFEQVVDGAGLVSDMARAAPGIKFLVTSRIPLRVSGEQEVPIAPLDKVDAAASFEIFARNESVQLFVERATAVKPDFALTPDNADAVADLINRLDGLPLAIELVVPKLKLLSVEAIVERLDTRALKGGSRDAPERHQSMSNAIAWSEESLPEPVRRLFAGMSVFVGGARLQEIEAVCIADELGVDVLDGLAVLVDHSLVRPEGDDRFRMLQVIREYAGARLAEWGMDETHRARHAQAYLERVEAMGPGLLGRERRRLLDELDADQDNIRAAMNHFVDAGQADAACRLTWSLWRYWQIRGLLYEARRRAELALALPQGDLGVRAKAIEALGGICWWQGDETQCSQAYEAALEIQLELGDAREIANAKYNAGLTKTFFAQDIPAGQALLNESLTAYEELGDTSGIADARWGLGNLEVFAKDDPEAAVPHLEKSVAGYRAARNVFGEGWAIFELGETLRRLGRLDEAERHFHEGLELLYGTGELSACVLFMMTFAAVARDRGNLERAYRLAGAGWGLAERTGVEVIGVAINRVEGFHRDELELLEGQEREWYHAGRLLSFDEAVDFALRR